MLWLPGNVSSSRRGVHRDIVTQGPPTQSYTIPLIHNGNVIRIPYAYTTLGGGPMAYVDNKSDSGLDTLSAAPGEGYNGSDALRVTCPDATAGLPGFWVIKANITGTASTSKLSGTDKFILPHGQNANRFTFYAKFPAGYRVAYSSGDGNFHVGTYNALTTSSSSDEDNNWHFYHYPYVNHSALGTDWVRVTVNNCPHHQRATLRGSHTAGLTTTLTGISYHEAWTKFYIDSVPYVSQGGVPEIAYPFDVLFSDLTLHYDTPSNEMSCEFVGHTTGSNVAFTDGEAKTLTVRIHNPHNTDIDVRVSTNAIWVWQPNLVDGASSDDNIVVTVPAFGTKDVSAEYEPYTSAGNNPLDMGTGARELGITCVPEDEVDIAGTSPNITSPYVLKQTQKRTGKMDAWPFSCHVYGVRA